MSTIAIFASEIMPLLLDSPCVANSDFIYDHWSRFPYTHRFLRQRIGQHHQHPCLFSTFIHEILQMPSISHITEEEKDELITGLIDVITWSRHQPHNLFSPRRLDEGAYTRRRETIETDLHIALIARSIIRNDIAEFDRVLDQVSTPGGPDFVCQYSFRFGILPIEIAVKIGSKEMFRALTARNRPMLFPDWYTNPRRPFVLAARYANKGFFEAWLEGEKNSSRPWTAQGCLNAALCSALKARNLDMLEYLGTLRIDQIAFADILGEAIKTGEVELVRWCLRYEDFHVHGSGRYKGPLWIALHDCPRATRLVILNMLLERGFDPNDAFSENRESLLQCAVRTQGVEYVKLLVQYGAYMDVDSSTSAWVEKQRSPLSLAAFKDSDTMQFLLQKGAIRRWTWRGKEHVVEHDVQTVRRIEDVFKDLGFGEQDVQEKHTEYYIMVNG